MNMTRHETCAYCGAYFGNEAGWEHHLKPDFSCMTDKEMRETKGFVWTAKGWTHEAKAVKRWRPNRG